MATRCNIEFVTTWTDSEGEKHINMRTVYRHNDGYPYIMIQDLMKFVAWNHGRMDDPEYTAANWIYWNKRSDEDQFLTEDVIRTTHEPDPVVTWYGREVATNVNHFLKLGHGVCNNFEHTMGIEYLYRVTTSPDNHENATNTCHIATFSASYDYDTGEFTFDFVGEVMCRGDESREEILHEASRIGTIDDDRSGT